MNEIYFKLAIKILEPCVNLFKVNPFLASVPILQPPKTPKNLRFFGIFRRYKMGTLTRNGLTTDIHMT